ncbi:P-loop containing nucleoside triphosphate hydrolase protein [Peniophora sp. CONT]|nr:P-loop containing nucleoside triphosphate hydrolase protein [Peniophora sp. CONT]
MEDEFDDGAPILGATERSEQKQASLSTEAAIRYVDENWYRAIARRGRWMDLIGDYAGSERFILDGEALFQRVLDDPLLALGRGGDPSFQFLHALYILEKFLHDMIKREAVFDIVFFDYMRHPTISGGVPQYTTASRGLARVLLFNHLVKYKDTIGLDVHVFEKLDDPAWKDYRRRVRPMFIMTNDGGSVDDLNDFESNCLLVQRMFIMRLLVTEGIAVTLLKGSDFIDLKIFSFVFEPRYNPDAQTPPAVLAATKKSLAALTSTEGHNTHHGSRLRLEAEQESSLSRVLEELVQKATFTDENPGGLGEQLMFLFVVHCILLPQVGIGHRARTLDVLNEELADYLTSTFLPAVFGVLTNVLLQRRDVIDCDGRLLVALLHYVVEKREESLESLVGHEIFGAAASIWRSAFSAGPPAMPFTIQYPNPSMASTSQQQTVSPTFQLIPFHNEVFDEELASVHVEVADDDEPEPEPLEFSQGQIFEDTRHWHAHRRTILPKHQGGEAEKPSTAWMQMKKLRKDQRFMASMHSLAATLTGAAGGSLQRIVIPPVGSKLKVVRKQLPPPQVHKQQKQSKNAKLSSADKIRLQKADADKAKSDAAADVWWKEQRQKLAALGNTAERIELMDRLSRNERTRAGWLSVEFALYRLDLEIISWIADSAADSDSVRDRYTVTLLRRVKDIYSSVHEHPSALPLLHDVLTALGFVDLIPTLNATIKGSAPTSGDARPLNFKFTKLIKRSTGKPVHKFMHITEEPIVWQLRLFGEYMDRSMDSQPDPRVSFQPDAWQRRVLDCIDRENCSVLVVAPTSAGKTFISFYAMEKILRESDDGILVYVSPTKALVNQVAAEVYARFSKDLNSGSCWAIHTRDYRIHDPQKCQILVTVPEMLAIMLLSPPLARVWTPRIKRIILDEVHTIGQHEGGSIWEQVLLLAPCPVIGLSATVGEPESFNNWLKSVQTAKGFYHELILHPHRYSHLRKYAYFPQLLQSRKPSFTGLDNPSSTGVMSFIHPLTALSFGTAALPSDLALESADALSTYHALVRVSEALPELDTIRLDPVTFFPSSAILTQKDVLRYEAALKDALKPLLATSNVQDSDSGLRGVVDCLASPTLTAVDADMLNTPPDGVLLRTGLIYLLSDLKSTGDLPALLFNFDRSDCERMARSLCETLEEAEGKWRDSSPEWKRKLEKVRVWQAGERERQRRAERIRGAKKSSQEEEARTAEDRSWESTFDESQPSEEFSFIGSQTAFSLADLEKEIDSLRWSSSIPEWAYHALRRGIAVHHSGMNKGYRNLVERLFRLRFLSVVIATGTLALGINAPTRTSVFCGDSPFLTALMYRQCAGRAGRRGFDTLGKVVFYGIPLDRIHRLMLSKLPRLTGTFPLSSTLALRLFNLLHGSKESDYARTAIRSILRLPQISFGSDVGRVQLLHHVRFSIDYLRRTQLLGASGQPINLFGVASHLYYTEPSNLGLVVLLQSGVLHNLCAPGGDKARRAVMLLLSHLFGRRQLPPAFTSRDVLAELRSKYPSMIVLPDMQQSARDVLLQHQRQILSIFTAYAVTFAEQHDVTLGLDNTLPLSRLRICGSSETGAPLLEHLASSSLRPIARSIFVTNSGHVDRFATVSELADTVRTGLHLNAHAIPSVDNLVSHNEQSHKLNAYLYDFFINGQSETLVRANSIRPGDRWFLLSDFDMTIKAIRGDLENLILHGAKGDAEQDAETDVDSGYQTFDATELMEDDDAVAGGTSARPSGVSDRDWRVLEVFNEVVKEFGEKFRAMWA